MRTRLETLRDDFGEAAAHVQWHHVVCSTADEDDFIMLAPYGYWTPEADDGEGQIENLCHALKRQDHWRHLLGSSGHAGHSGGFLLPDHILNFDDGAWAGSFLNAAWSPTIGPDNSLEARYFRPEAPTTLLSGRDVLAQDRDFQQFCRLASQSLAALSLPKPDDSYACAIVWVVKLYLHLDLEFEVISWHRGTFVAGEPPTMLVGLLDNICQVSAQILDRVIGDANWEEGSEPTFSMTTYGTFPSIKDLIITTFCQANNMLLALEELDRAMRRYRHRDEVACSANLPADIGSRIVQLIETVAFLGHLLEANRGRFVRAANGVASIHGVSSPSVHQLVHQLAERVIERICQQVPLSAIGQEGLNESVFAEHADEVARAWEAIYPLTNADLCWLRAALEQEVNRALEHGSAEPPKGEADTAARVTKKRRGPKIKQLTLQRAEHAKKLVDADGLADGWDVAYAAYRQEHPEDDEVTCGSYYHAYDRVYKPKKAT